MTRRPDWRLEVLGTGGESADAFVAGARANPEAPDIVGALEIFDDPERRGLLEAFILAGTPADGICSRFGISSSILAAFQALCFDVAGLSPIDKTLLLHDEEVPDIVRRLREVGFRHGPAELDFLLGLAPDLDEHGRRRLEQRAVDRLVARAARSDDLAEIGSILTMIARFRAGSPVELTGGAKSELDGLIKNMFSKLEKVPIPAGIPDLELHLARPNRS